MALVLKDRVKETTTTTGTGTVTLAGAVSGFQSFSAIGNANTTYYAIIGDTEWEIGIGTYTSSGTTLSRDTVLASSNSGSLVSFSAGTKTVFCDYPATKSVSTDSLATPPAIGGTTPSTVTATTLIGGGGSANYGQLTGGATTKAVEFKTIGSDTNVGLAIRSQGTGAIDLAAGSSGVNISNGGTVTAITGTAGGSYTVVPTITISAPTTAGGTQATGTCAMNAVTISVASGGSGYAIADTITLTGGTFSTSIILTVASLSGSAVATFTAVQTGTYTVLPTNPISQGSSSGAGTGATFNITSWGVRTTAYTITGAGSGYVEQPTVTFSSGSAAAYATVGSSTVQKTIGNIHTFATPNSNVLALVDKNSAGNYPTNSTVAFSMIPSQSGFGASYLGFGSAAYLGTISTATTAFQFATSVSSPVSNGGGGSTQMTISHTASAVNYVQVTGSATSGYSVISAQGSDTNTGLYFQAKGTTGSLRFSTNGANSNEQFRVSNTASAVNYLNATGAAAGASPTFAVAGTDTDIDLTLTPKGAGAVRFGTYTASVLTPTGYITIKDSGGTSRRLLVG